jgi:hypothetical protein
MQKMKQKEQLIGIISKNGIDLNQIKSHMRSNSVGGMGAFDHQRLQEFLIKSKLAAAGKNNGNEEQKEPEMKKLCDNI